MSDLISRKVVVDLVEIEDVFMRYSDGRLSLSVIEDIRALLDSSPAVEQGEAVAYMDTAGNLVKDCHLNSMRARGEELTPLFQSPQQPQSVADALEEAANIEVIYKKSGRDDALTKIVEDVIQEAVESAISQYKETIRTLIKRNAAKEGE